MESLQGKWALVTGASSGTGRDFASALAERGANLILVARRIERTQQLAEELRSRHTIQVKVDGVDLSLPGAAEKLKSRLDADDISVEILVNNAAFGIISEFVDQSLDKIDEMLQVNVIALTELTHVFANSMKARGSGHILLVGSIAGYRSCPLYAAYAATKAYLLSLGVALHTELAPHNVVVTVLSPGVMDTGFFEVAGQSPNASMRRMMMKPRPVVDIGLAALFQKKSSVVAGAMNRMMTLGSRVISRQFAARLAYTMGKQ